MPVPKNSAAQFLELIEPWATAYSHVVLSYIAVRGPPAKILFGQVQLAPFVVVSELTSRTVETSNLVAGRLCLAAGDLGVLVRSASEGRINLPAFTGILETEGGPPDAFVFTHHHPDTFGEESYLPLLQVTGRSKQRTTDLALLDRELRTCRTPYLNFSDLSLDLRLPPRAGADQTHIEVAALPVSAFEESSTISGRRARIVCSLANTLEKGDCLLGWIQTSRDRPAKRHSAPGTTLQWARHKDGYHSGTLEIDVEPGTHLDCFLSYRGTLQDRATIIDPAALPNSRAASYCAFDGPLGTLRYQLFEEGRQRKDARHFEQGIASLLHCSDSARFISARHWVTHLTFSRLRPADAFLLSNVRRACLTKETNSPS